MQRLVHKHALATRWFHWVNFPVLAAMVGSGLLIYWANDVYHVGPVHLFPDRVYSLLGLDHRLSLGMGWHFLFGWLFVANGLFFTAYTFLSGEWRDLVPQAKHFPAAWQVVLHDLGIRKAPLPPGKFNAAQRVTYTAILIMGALSTITGLAIYKPTQLAWLAWLCGGYEAARFEHFWLMVGFCLFFGLHLGQVIRAGWNNYRSMVIGVELVDEPDPATPPAAATRSAP